MIYQHQPVTTSSKGTNMRQQTIKQKEKRKKTILSNHLKKQPEERLPDKPIHLVRLVNGVIQCWGNRGKRIPGADTLHSDTPPSSLPQRNGKKQQLWNTMRKAPSTYVQVHAMVSLPWNVPCQFSENTCTQGRKSPLFRPGVRCENIRLETSVRALMRHQHKSKGSIILLASALRVPSIQLRGICAADINSFSAPEKSLTKTMVIKGRLVPPSNYHFMGY